MQVNWEAMAAMVSLFAIPLMLSGQAAKFCSYILRQLQRRLYVQGSTCERLEWRDIPDGLLHDEYSPPFFTLGERPTYAMVRHSEEKCFESTISRVFTKAWVSAARRNVTVPKPVVLDPKKRYIRLDRQTLEALMMASSISKPPVFGNISGVLTLHLEGSFLKCRPRDGTILHRRTKSEMERLLDGYPPFYMEKISVTSNMTVRNPIKSEADFTRGGWILAVGLDMHRTPALITHNMSFGYETPVSWAEKFPKSRRGKQDWWLTCMGFAVQRLGDTLFDLETLFPDEQLIESAASLFRALTTREIKFQTRPWDVLQRLSFPKREEYRWRWWDRMDFGDRLSDEQWQMAMEAFSHHGSLSTDEHHLFADEDRRNAIIQAAMLGLILVMSYGHMHAVSWLYRKLPSTEGMDGHKYVYLECCEPSVEDER